MSFQARAQWAEVFEGKVLKRLRGRGYPAHPFGQLLLPRALREELKAFHHATNGHPSLFRWLPDIIITDAAPPRDLQLVEVKRCLGPNYAIEIKSVECAEICTEHLFTPTVFVFDDWGVLTVGDIRRHGVAGPVPEYGSGTPYLLVPRQHGRSFGLEFPPRHAPSMA